MTKNYLTEMHLHTKETSNCGKMPAAETVENYIFLGFNTIVVTDHFSTHTYFKYDYNSLSWQEKVDIFLKGYNTAKDAAKGRINILLGMELRFDSESDPNDYLVYGIDENFLREHKDILDMNISSFSALARKNGLMIFQAHPFRFGMKITNVKYLDGIEVCNRNIEHDSHNDIAALWAEKFGLKKTAGSDHHQKGNEGLAGIISKHEITSNKVLLDTLKKQDYTLYEKQL
ncbi:MAG: PHP domain-containing protein [Ruminococcus sp.]|nr:PHP domain-containing protein [Ruminococcus sp.]MDY3896054.1 PHP domain-containing protein [Candidatus Fimenecus sp.]